MMYDVDAHAYDEPRYEACRARFAAAMCERCGEYEAEKDDEWCTRCIAEYELEDDHEDEAA